MSFESAGAGEEAALAGLPVKVTARRSDQSGLEWRTALAAASMFRSYRRCRAAKSPRLRGGAETRRSAFNATQRTKGGSPCKIATSVSSDRSCGSARNHSPRLTAATSDMGNHDRGDAATRGGKAITRYGPFSCSDSELRSPVGVPALAGIPPTMGTWCPGRTPAPAGNTHQRESLH